MNLLHSDLLLCACRIKIVELGCKPVAFDHNEWNKMNTLIKKTKLAMFIAFLLLILPSHTFAVIDVKEFGAKGDNSADDTVAIQAAFDAQRKPPYSMVYFPAGRYVVSDTIKMYSPNVRGESFINTIIVQKSKNKDIFYVEFAWRGQVSDLTFNGGAKQLNMRNIRVDQGLLHVKDCSFNGSSDFAIYMAPQSNPMHLIIRGCHFDDCAQVLYTVCDWTTFGDSWITTARMKNRAAIEASGDKLLCENIVGVPIVTGDNDRWIDFSGNDLTCRNVRFGGEFGGMTPIYNFSKLNKNGTGGSIILEDCRVAAQGSPTKCAVYCEQIPNSLIIRDCILTVPSIILSPEIQIEEYFKYAAEGVLNYDLLQNESMAGDNAQAIALQEFAKKRDTSFEPLTGQLDANETIIVLEKVVAKVKTLTQPSLCGAEFNGHKQKMNAGNFIDINLSTHTWDINDLMDSTVVKNYHYIAIAQAGDDIVFMRRAPNGSSGAWPHVLVKDVEVDLDKTPFLTWRQKDPGTDPLPKGYITRNESNRLDSGIVMPNGYGMRVLEKRTKKFVFLHEAHMPPWYDYRSYDLREVFGIKSGKIVIDIKYYPLGAYITGLAGSGFAIPPEYQIIDFLRLESQ